MYYPTGATGDGKGHLYYRGPGAEAGSGSFEWSWAVDEYEGRKKRGATCGILHELTTGKAVLKRMHGNCTADDIETAARLAERKTGKPAPVPGEPPKRRSLVVPITLGLGALVVVYLAMGR